jgi:hypothetical protein
MNIKDKAELLQIREETERYSTAGDDTVYFILGVCEKGVLLQENLK